MMDLNEVSRLLWWIITGLAVGMCAVVLVIPFVDKVIDRYFGWVDDVCRRAENRIRRK